MPPAFILGKAAYCICKTGLLAVNEVLCRAACYRAQGCKVSAGIGGEGRSSYGVEKKHGHHRYILES